MARNKKSKKTTPGKPVEIDFDSVADAELQIYMDQINAAMKRRHSGGGAHAADSAASGASEGIESIRQKYQDSPGKSIRPVMDVHVGVPSINTTGYLDDKTSGYRETLADAVPGGQKEAPIVPPTEINLASSGASSGSQKPMEIGAIEIPIGEQAQEASRSPRTRAAKKRRAGRRIDRLLANPAINERLMRKGALDESGAAVEGFNPEKLNRNERRVYNYRRLQQTKEVKHLKDKQAELNKLGDLLDI